MPLGNTGLLKSLLLGFSHYYFRFIKVIRVGYRFRKHVEIAIKNNYFIKKRIIILYSHPSQVSFLDLETVAIQADESNTVQVLPTSPIFEGLEVYFREIHLNPKGCDIAKLNHLFWFTSAPQCPPKTHLILPLCSLSLQIFPML